MSNGGA